MSANRAHDTLQQLVAGRMTVRVVDRLQADDVDVGNDEEALRSASTIDLVIEVRKPRPARARTGQYVCFSDRQLV